MFRFQQRFVLSSRTRPAALRRRRSLSPEMGRLETRELLSSVSPGIAHFDKAPSLLYSGPPVPPQHHPGIDTLDKSKPWVYDSPPVPNHPPGVFPVQQVGIQHTDSFKNASNPDPQRYPPGPC
jgi:hypothetical protein